MYMELTKYLVNDYTKTSTSAGLLASTFIGLSMLGSRWSGRESTLNTWYLMGTAGALGSYLGVYLLKKN